MDTAREERALRRVRSVEPGARRRGKPRHRNGGTKWRRISFNGDPATFSRQKSEYTNLSLLFILLACTRGWPCVLEQCPLPEPSLPPSPSRRRKRSPQASSTHCFDNLLPSNSSSPLLVKLSRNPTCRMRDQAFAGLVRQEAACANCEAERRARLRKY